MISAEQAKKIEDIVHTAGSILLSAHVGEAEVHQKSGPANFVTDYDVKIQEYLISELSSVVPTCSFYGEEDTNGNEHRVSDGYTFFIDPIDGTTNFMFDYRNSCVSVGLALVSRDAKNEKSVSRCENSVPRSKTIKNPRRSGEKSAYS